jgi:hypothetical protein
MSARLLAFDQSGLGQILAILGQRQLRPSRSSWSCRAVQLGDVTAQFLLVGNGARGRGANLDQRFLHFHDDHADHLGRVFGRSSRSVTLAAMMSRVREKMPI